MRLHFVPNIMHINIEINANHLIHVDRVKYFNVVHIAQCRYICDSRTFLNEMTNLELLTVSRFVASDGIRYAFAN